MAGGIVSGPYDRVTGAGKRLYCDRITGNDEVLPVGEDVQCLSVIIQSSNNNQGTVLVGNAYVQWYELTGGEEVEVKVDNLSLVYIDFPVGDTVVNILAFLPAGG